MTDRQNLLSRMADHLDAEVRKTKHEDEWEPERIADELLAMVEQIVKPAPTPPLTFEAPTDVKADMPDPSVKLCVDCIAAYRDGIEPGETACEARARGEQVLPSLGDGS